MNKILVIDDEEEITSALKRVLDRAGYLVEISDSVELAIEKISSGVLYDLVISDIIMNGLTGIDFIKYISELNLNLPVILITGNPNLGSAESAVRYKAFDYISKPVARNQILSVVKNAIETKTNKDFEINKNNQSELMEKVLRSQNLDLNRQNSAILNAMNDAVITIDSRKTIVSANIATFTMFNYQNPGNLFGQSIEVLFPEFKAEKYLEMAKMVISNKEKNSTLQLPDVSLLRSDGTTFFADISVCSYVLDGEMYITGVLRDVTQKKMMVTQLIDSERRAFLATVAASIGHEINNSLTAIQGFVDMATKENADIKLKDRALQVTLNQTQKLHTLTSNLLHLGKSSKNKQEDLEDIEINLSIKSILDVFKQTARLKYCQINWTPTENQIFVRTNADQFAILLTNLLINAADATHNTGNIDISIETQDEKIFLHVSDNGTGMNQETINHIYEPYFTTKEMGKGTGLGMFVVKQIIDTFGIELNILSELGKGSTFTFTFPSAK